MGIQEALEFFEIPKGRRQTLENVRGKTFAVDSRGEERYMKKSST